MLASVEYYIKCRMYNRFYFFIETHSVIKKHRKLQSITHQTAKFSNFWVNFVPLKSARSLQVDALGMVKVGNKSRLKLAFGRPVSDL